MNILIGGAWPYANGPLHIGHIAGLLPGDILARYYRAKGDTVFYVSGTDCHGTPICIKAKKENKSPQEICDEYHNEFTDVFNRLGFSYDLYGKTTEQWHKDFVTEFHKQLYKSKFVYEKDSPQAYCNHCEKPLTDRLVTGICPVCGHEANGEQCDACGNVTDAGNLKEAKCSECGNPVSYYNAKHLYIAISKLEEQLKDYLNKHNDWRNNAIAFTKRYIDEGLRDRAITRNLEWGIKVPKEGYEDKRIYIWAENVLGYLSASKVLCDKRNIPFDDLWKNDSRHYYVHGKDNIPFHTIILPSLLLAHNQGYHLPDDIISNEHLTLEGRKISTSKNWAIWAKDIVKEYSPDTIRFFLVANGPEKRDTDFTWSEFAERNNSELLGIYGNFVNRTLLFIKKYQYNIVPKGIADEEIQKIINDTYANAGKNIENGRLKEALLEVISLVRYGNKYYDTKEPWKTRTSNIADCDNTIFNCTQIIANAAVLFRPFIPFSSDKVLSWLDLSYDWEIKKVKEGYTLPEISILFERITIPSQPQP